MTVRKMAGSISCGGVLRALLWRRRMVARSRAFANCEGQRMTVTGAVAHGPVRGTDHCWYSWCVSVSVGNWVFMSGLVCVTLCEWEAPSLGMYVGRARYLLRTLMA
ncbi:hypothetical protein RRG08_044174 [Elysia crispata]|uniref:Uncharacterized protein n=1 Tax=Elysia crispata TaxID=231223 RepID=A0AAE0XWI4_9GAST|nr:hypothetical protein RRG08_044174 [Elysia crispata]